MTNALKKNCGLSTVPGVAAGAAKHPALVHHLLVWHWDEGPELFCIPSRSGEEALPVFSSMEIAQTFALYSHLGRKWQAREYCASELVSLLALYTDIDWVLLDPLPYCIAEEEAPAILMRWEDFIDLSLG